jgi:hypothetical protein
MAVAMTAPAGDREGASAALSPEARRIGVTFGGIAVVLPFVLEALTIVRANHAWLVHRLPDDAYYYLEVGRRLGRGEGFTFDGVHETNGFHPLWQLLLAPFGRAVGDDDLYAKVALLLGVVLSLAAVLLVVRVVARAVGTGPALFGAVVAVHGTGVLGSWVNGMEGPVVLVSLALVLTALAAWAEQPSPRRAVVTGLLCAVAVVARLDLVFVIWAVAVAMAIRERARRWILWWVAGAGAIGVPFAAVWLLRWGQVLTTSATVKRSTLDQLVEDRYGSRWSASYVGFLVDTAWNAGATVVRRVQPGDTSIARFERLVLFALAGIGAVRGLSRRRWHTRLDPAMWAIVIVGVVVLSKAVVDVLAAPLWTTAWYAAPRELAFPFVVGTLAWLGVRWICTRSVPVGVACGVLAVMIVLPMNLREFTVSGDHEPIAGRWQDELDVAADWIRLQGPDGRYGAYDAGLLGYRLDGDRTFVNLDGLVNNYEFAALVDLRADAPTRIRATAVDFLVNRLSDDQLHGELECARPVWRSDHAVPYWDGAQKDPQLSYIHVLDVRACRNA